MAGYFLVRYEKGNRRVMEILLVLLEGERGVMVGYFLVAYEKGNHRVMKILCVLLEGEGLIVLGGLVFFVFFVLRRSYGRLVSCGKEIVG